MPGTRSGNFVLDCRRPPKSVEIGRDAALAVVVRFCLPGAASFDLAGQVAQMAVLGVVGGEKALGEAGERGGLADLARFRSEPGLGHGEGTLARLDLGGRSFYGINAHGQPGTLRVNAITRTHAEADAFQQAANAGMNSERATLYVDRALCPACGSNGGVRGMMHQLGLQELRVVTPQGTQVIRP